MITDKEYYSYYRVNGKTNYHRTIETEGFRKLASKLLKERSTTKQITE